MASRYQPRVNTKTNAMARAPVIFDLPLDVLSQMLLAIVDVQSFGAAASACASWHQCVADLQRRTRQAKQAQGVEVHPRGRFGPANIALTLGIDVKEGAQL